MKVCPRCGHGFRASGWQCPACGRVPERVAGCLSLTADGFVAEGDVDASRLAELAELQPCHFWFRARARLLAWAIASYFGGARTFLEIGSGTGFTLAEIHRRLPHLDVVGSDSLGAAAAIARQGLADIEFLLIDGRNIPYEDEFDIVAAFDVLEHIDDDEGVLRQMFRALHPGGGVLITVPQHPMLWSAVDEYSGHARRYTRRQMCAKLGRAGFQVQRTTSFCSALLPLLAVSRLPRPRFTRDFDPFAEYRWGRFTNAALEAVLSIEFSVIERGVSLPAGGSLLVVGRRPAGGRPP